MRPIDADVLYMRMKRGAYFLHGGSPSISRDVALGRIANTPTLTLDDLRPKGWWNIVEIDKANNRIMVECSECGMVEEMYLNTYGMGHNYCHSCGADMRGGREDS